MTTKDTLPTDQNEPFDGIKENRETRPPAYFNFLYYGLILWGIIFMGYYLLSGWSSHDEFQEKMTTHQEQTSQGMQGGKE
ncbi:MAG: hypothetical protein KJ950_04495 [Proteobacteria bacterium]|nr:hypothetical protein [Pseudomonadota bacterium]MBU1688526.1 hypothetical protein [Pseudomonadota bacterium]